MNPTELLTIVREAIFDHVTEDLRTLQDAGFMTTDDGIAVRMSDGSEFVLTIEPA